MSKEFFPRRALKRYLSVDGLTLENYELMMAKLKTPPRAKDHELAFKTFRGMLAVRGQLFPTQAATIAEAIRQKKGVTLTVDENFKRWTMDAISLWGTLAVMNVAHGSVSNTLAIGGIGLLTKIGFNFAGEELGRHLVKNAARRTNVS